MKGLKGHRVLVVRDDRIGDLVLALPLIQALHEAGAKVAVWASAYAAPLLEGDGRVERVLVDPTPEQLRAGAFDVALCLHARWQSAWALFRAAIPARWGPSARPFSALFTARLPLRRGRGWEHESELNFAYARALGLDGEPPRPRLQLSPEARRQARAWLRRHAPAGRGPLAVLHPGSRGSAQDWPVERYVALAEVLRRRHGVRPFFSGGPGEEAVVELCRRAVKGSGACAAALPLPVFAALLGEADLVAAGSTGPLHLAAAQGVPVLGFYPARRAMSPLRWAPRGSRRAVLSPAGLGFRVPRRSRINEVAHISVDEAAAAAEFLLRDLRPSGRRQGEAPHRRGRLAAPAVSL
jgi:ADP-heptose:LPS heptosyltransferase